MLNSAVQIFAPGIVLVTSVVSASSAIPATSASSSKPKYIRVAATAAAYVRIGLVGLTAAIGDALVQPGDPVIFMVSGNTHVAAIQVTAAGVVQVSPLEDQ